MSNPDATILRRRRGVVRASITRITNRLKELEGKADQPTTLDIAQRTLKKLDTLEAEFKTHHYALIDLIDDDDDLREEQELLDRHDDEMSTLVVLPHLLQ